MLRIALAMIGFGAIIIAGYLDISASASRTWNSTDGTVVANYVLVTGAGNAATAGDSDSYSPVVSYKYRVGSVVYVNSKVGFGEYFFDHRSSDRLMKLYPKGRRVTVYYDPNDPNNAVLNRAYPTVAMVFLSSVALLCLLGAVFMRSIVNALVRAFVSQRGSDI